MLQYEVATADRVISIPRRRTSVPGSQQQLYSRRFYLYEAFTSAVILAVNRAGPIKRDRASVLSLPTFDVRLDRTISLEINGKPHYASRSRIQRFDSTILVLQVGDRAIFKSMLAILESSTAAKSKSIRRLVAGMKKNKKEKKRGRETKESHESGDRQ